jgi:hypothetical protein
MSLIQIAPDSLKDTIQNVVKAVQDSLTFVGPFPEPETQPLINNQVLITALLAATFTQLLVVLISWIRNELDLLNKKKLILDDLREKRKTLLDLKEAYRVLLEKFKNRDVDSHEYLAFTELNADVFNAVSKPDLYKIFGKRMIKISDIYNMIVFLKKHDVEFTYQDYLNKINNHTEKMKGVKGHDFWCETHVGFVDRAIMNIGKHIAATNGAITLIDEQLPKEIKRSH